MLNVLTTKRKQKQLKKKPKGYKEKLEMSITLITAMVS